MNFVYLATCCVIIYYILNENYRAKKSERRLAKDLGLADEILPKLMPQSFGEAPAAQTGEVFMGGRAEDYAPTGLFAPQFPGGSNEKFKEFALRLDIEATTMAILKSHSFSISYEKSWALAEEIIGAQYAAKDKPLSDKMKALLPTATQPGVPPQMTSGNAQATAAPIQ